VYVVLLRLTVALAHWSSVTLLPRMVVVVEPLHDAAWAGPAVAASNPAAAAAVIRSLRILPPP
jgi:hypothetical protein